MRKRQLKKNVRKYRLLTKHWEGRERESLKPMELMLKWSYFSASHPELFTNPDKVLAEFKATVASR